jgi:tetratricopeptide (TPR) repeat protein
VADAGELFVDSARIAHRRFQFAVSVDSAARIPQNSAGLKHRAGSEKGILRERSLVVISLGPMKKFPGYLLVMAILSGFALPAIAQVRVWQGTLSLPTYEEGPPDPNPPFDQFATTRFNYPYTLRTNVTARRADHQWRAIFLENEYLKCSILPDLGGHLYTCVDKINNQPMFYANPSIKKANIGYRGAWAAFGVEFNFPVSHNWMSLSPIDFAFAKNSDGSASVTVGNVDRVYGMRWSVEMVLRPKSTLLEERVTLSNRSDVRHRFYWWNNAGVEVWDDSKIEYPMRFTASHGFTEVEPWPVDSSGRDLSIIHNQTSGPVSLFVHGSREPFMGVWNPHTNSGTVHFANFNELPAKKTWSWGVDADGLDWRKALSDNDSAYVEVQAGLFRNQETYAFLQPRQTINFSEYWMPVRDIGGITRANLSGVLALRRQGSALSIGFNANQALSAATISVSDGSIKVWNGIADLAPERTWSHEVALPNSDYKYTVTIRDRSGAAVMQQTEGEYDWTPASEIKVGPQTSHQIPAPEMRSEDDWIELGKTQELNGELLQALQTYSDLLKKNGESYAGLKAAGRLSASLLHYEDAATFLQRALDRNTTDAETAYYLGIAYEGIESPEKARNAFEIAFRLPEWRAAAAVRLAEFSAREQKLDLAKFYLSSALKADPDDLRAAEELVAIEKALGMEKQARALAEESLQRFPLSDFLRNGVGSLDPQHLANDHSRILNLAREYMRLGLYPPALDVLSRQYPEPRPNESEPGVSSPARDPMLAYYRAYCREKLDESRVGDDRIAASLPTDYVFPSGAEDLIVLRAAVQANASDANAHYLLGTLYFSRALTDRALAEWNAARKLNPKIPVLDASLALALLHVKNDPESALEVFREGIHNDPRNEAGYLGADQTLSIVNRPSKERVEVLELYPDMAQMPTQLVFELALNLAEAGDFARASALFRSRFFPREEGGTNVRQVWVEVQLLNALDQANSQHCEAALATASRIGSPVAGVAFTNDGLQPFLESARTNYLLGKVNAQCKRSEEARKYFENAAEKSGRSEIVWAWRAARQLPAFDQNQWTSRLNLELRSTANSGNGLSVYSEAMIDQALGHQQKADAEFRQVFLLPDHLLSYHLAREAMANQ